MRVTQRHIVLLFALIGGGVFFNARHNPFVYDDHHSIQYNPHIRSLRNIPAFFTDPHTFSSERTGFMFRPVLLITYAVNYALGGQQVQGYRWVNVGLHIGCAILLYLLVGCLTASERVARAAGLVFLVHPAHGEPINYISARSDLLVSLFYLGGCALAIQGSGKARWGSLGAYAGGLLVKEAAITFPVAILMLQGIREGWRRVLASRRFLAGLILLSGIYLTVIWANRFIASSAAKAPRALEVQGWTQLKGLVYYLWLFVVPTGLNVEHPFAVSSVPWEPAVILAGLFLGSLGVMLTLLQNNWIRLGGIWFVLTLLPASLVPLNILMSERRAYLASAGLILIGVWAWGAWAARRRGPAIWIGVAIGVIFAALCIQRNQVWNSEISLWEDAVRKGPGMHRARLNLGLAYEREGRRDEALRELKAGLQLKPDFADAWVTLGNIFKDQGEDGKAEEAYRKALYFNPQLEGVYHNLGNIYLSGRNDPERAIAYYEECLKRNAHFVKARPNLGQAYEAMGRLGDALRQYELGIADSLYWEDPRDPELGGTWFNLARLSQRLGDVERAREAYRRAYTLLNGDPQYQRYAEQAWQGWRELEEAGR